ncbi:hypothetical protein CTI12_AA455200 [Artemisia annua]|uniref:Uncharacterized protein n=1 Tax=Artemisia annua TaxID=35608 RepID=A0A2U1LU25_ARTAN|nr:hypothetical protein CTI12_AA455200 [Artemisia annua]
MLQTPRYPVEGRPNEFRRMIERAETYWQQINFKYVIGNIALPMAGAHQMGWRMTEYVSDNGDGINFCGISIALPMAGAHQTGLRMTDYVSNNGDG